MEVSPAALSVDISAEAATLFIIGWARGVVEMFEGSGVDVTIRTVLDTSRQSQILAQTRRGSDTAAL